jgi:fumarate hydratase class II
MHVAAALELHNRLLPALRRLTAALAAQEEAAAARVVKIGRTHMQVHLGRAFVCACVLGGGDDGVLLLN